MKDEKLNLDSLRQQLDVLDDNILELLKKRANLVLDVKRAKNENNINVYSPAREKQIIDRIKEKAADGNFPLDALESIFINIISASRSLIGDLQVAYLGQETLDAGIKQFGETVNFLAQDTIEDAFHSVESSASQYAVLPARYEVYKRLVSSNLIIIAERDSRYLVIGTLPSNPTGNDKTSAGFILEDRPGILNEIMQPLSEKGLTMLKIESRSISSDNTQFFFYIEVNGHIKDIGSDLEKILSVAKSYKVLGSYGK